MTPTQSRELASLIQTFSPSQKADFYYFTIVQNQDPIAYIAQMRKQSLVDLMKASFGGDRSAAGRYAAEQRWKGHKKQDKQSSSALKDAIIKSFPKMMQVKSKPWWLGDTEEIRTMVELTFSDEVGEKAFSGNITLADYDNPALAGGNCGIASAEVASFLIQEGLAKEGEVFMREVDEPWYGQQGGTHFVTHIGPKDSDDAIIVDITLRQFDSDADFPWIGTVKEYRAQGYEDEASLADGVKRPQMNDESFDMVLASGEVVYPWDQPGFKGDEDSE